MKANELMIGDWVLINGTPRKIQAVDGVDDGIMADDELYTLAEDRYHSEDRVEGVPITAKILEKNGFSQDPLNGHIFIFHEKSGEVIYYEYGPKYGLTIDNQLATIQDLKIKYIHELQNALSLCGIDKEIII